MAFNELLLHPHFFFFHRGAGGRSQRRGRRAAPGREEAEPARVGGERPGLWRGVGGPAGTAASASKNFLGTASPGRSPQVSSLRPLGGMEPLHLLSTVASLEG